jgi:hypothetical protein
VTDTVLIPALPLPVVILYSCGRQWHKVQELYVTVTPSSVTVTPSSRVHLLHVRKHLACPLGVQHAAHAEQRDHDDVAVTQLRTRTHLLRFQPEPVRQVDVLGPRTRRVRTEVEEYPLVAVVRM